MPRAHSGLSHHSDAAPWLWGGSMGKGSGVQLNIELEGSNKQTPVSGMFFICWSKPQAASAHFCLSEWHLHCSRVILQAAHNETIITSPNSNVSDRQRRRRRRRREHVWSFLWSCLLEPVHLFTARIIFGRNVIPWHRKWMIHILRRKASEASAQCDREREE